MTISLTSGVLNLGDQLIPQGLAKVDYRPTDVNILFGTLPLHHGISEGTFVTARRNKPTWRGLKGCDGEGCRIRTNDFSASITVSIRQGSPVNDFLSSHILADEITGVLAVPMFIDHVHGRSTYISMFTSILAPVDMAFGTGEGDNVWSFFSDNFQPITGGFNPFLSAPFVDPPMQNPISTLQGNQPG